MTLDDEINALNGLLVKYQEQKWRLPTVQGKQNAVRILSKMAGMGSLNDLYISAANGHNIAPSEEDAVNHLLRMHLAAIRHGCDSLLSQQG